MACRRFPANILITGVKRFDHDFLTEANLVYGPYSGSDAMSAFLQRGQSAIETPMYGVVQSVATWTVDKDAEAYAEQLISIIRSQVHTPIMI